MKKFNVTIYYHTMATASVEIDENDTKYDGLSEEEKQDQMEADAIEMVENDYDAISNDELLENMKQDGSDIECID